MNVLKRVGVVVVAGLALLLTACAPAPGGGVEYFVPPLNQGVSLAGEPVSFQACTTAHRVLWVGASHSTYVEYRIDGGPLNGGQMVSDPSYGVGLFVFVTDFTPSDGQLHCFSVTISDNLVMGTFTWAAVFSSNLGSG
jgi:hypothetical protein